MPSANEQVAVVTSREPETARPVTTSLPLSKSSPRLLYGVQGTGNGHISRATAMHKALEARGVVDVTWVMSGRPPQKLMCCDEYLWYRGMTFAARNGKVNAFKTVTGNNMLAFFRDIRRIDLDHYDLIVTDFEPVVAWAARRRGRKTLGIGHQYAFTFPVPVVGNKPLSEKIMRYFAPADTPVGLHWHHFQQPILPPIVAMHGVNLAQERSPDKVLVYLPFENQDALVKLFEDMPQWRFYIYSPEMENYDRGNIHTRAISKIGFKNDLVTAGSIIANSGFELISECLTLGKKILTKPLQGQIEQLSNARALADLGYATVCDNIDGAVIRRWLDSSPDVYRVDYPDVAATLAGWLCDGGTRDVAQLSAELWRQTSVHKI